MNPAKLCKALITASHGRRTMRWDSSLEQTLHALGFRTFLTPSLVANTIFPGLLNHHALALGFFNWSSQQPGFSHTSETYQSLFQVLSHSQRFKTVENLLKQIRTHHKALQLKPPAYSTIIYSQLISGKTQEAYSTFAEMEKLFGCEIDSKLGNSLLAALASDGFLGLAEIVFCKMGFRNIGFTDLGFGVFIGRFCREKEIGKTLGLLDNVKQKFPNINGSVLAFLIVDGLCRVSRVTDAWWVLDELRIRDCKPDFIPYRIVAEAFRNMGRFDEAEKVLKQKRKMGVAPRAHEYRDFIFALIEERRIVEARELAEAIVSGNFPIEDDVLNALIGSISGIDPDSGVSFCKSIIASDRFPAISTLSNLSRNLCRSGKTDQMWDLFRVLSSKGYFLDTNRYNIMIEFLCKGGKVKEAYGALKEMRKNGLVPDVVSYNYVMEACCREDLLRPARRLWDEMFSMGCVPNLLTYNILIRKFSDTGEVEEAGHLYYRMLEKKIMPDTITYTSLIKGFCREAKIIDAYEIFNKSMEHDVQLVGSTLTTLVYFLCKAGNFYAASKVIHGSLPSETENSRSHVVLPKSLADKGEFEMAIEHVEWVRESSPVKLKAISSELIASLSSSPKPEPILQLLHAMYKKGLVSDCGHWMDFACTTSRLYGKCNPRAIREPGQVEEKEHLIPYLM